MRVLFLFLLISGLSSCVFAQELGYIQNDSAYISGYITTQSETRSATSCVFRLNDQSPVKTYTPDQILAYGYDKSDYYSRKLKIGNDTVKKFMLAIVQGDSPVYYLAEESGKHFYILNSRKELVELVEKDGEYKQQLATYYDAPASIIPGIHNSFTIQGLIKTIEIMKLANQEVVNGQFNTQDQAQQGLTIKQKRRMRIIRPAVSITLQSGVTFQGLTLDLPVNLPPDWDKIKANSITFSLAADVPLIKYWPVTFHQEISYNKFVTNYMQGANPPNYQLIQDFSVLSLPMMVRYTLGRKKLRGFVNAGLQIDVSLNKENVGWLVISSNSKESGASVDFGYSTYNTVQPGFTAGFGGSYDLNTQFALNVEYRYSGIGNVSEDMVGLESQSALKAGITYSIFKQEKKP
jgi:hypothetical protein